jgi:glutathione S-transferase
MVRRPGDAPCLVSYHKPDDSNLAAVSGLIYHIARRADWERARADGEYTRSTVDKTLAEEGFIHASQAPQVAGTANKFYRDVPGGLVLLVIDPGLLRAEVRYEDVPGAELPFPHVYGPLNVEAVVEARPFAAGPDGTFTFDPSDLSEGGLGGGA